VSWSGQLNNGPVNFILPLVVALRAVDAAISRIQANRGYSRDSFRASRRRDQERRGVGGLGAAGFEGPGREGERAADSDRSPRGGRGESPCPSPASSDRGQRKARGVRVWGAGAGGGVGVVVEVDQDTGEEGEGRAVGRTRWSSGAARWWEKLCAWLWCRRRGGGGRRRGGVGGGEAGCCAGVCAKLGGGVPRRSLRTVVAPLPKCLLPCYRLLIYLVMGVLVAMLVSSVCFSLLCLHSENGLC
jgi:hypothetical protein